MHTDVRLSTCFLTTQNAHQVEVLVSLSGDRPLRRAPINLALLLDRSGSLSVVAFDDTVEPNPWRRHNGRLVARGDWLCRGYSTAPGSLCML